MNELIFITKTSHLASLWNGGWGELGNGLSDKGAHLLSYNAQRPPKETEALDACIGAWVLVGWSQLESRALPGHHSSLLPDQN